MLTSHGPTPRYDPPPIGRRPDGCGKEKWRIFSVGLESTTVTPLAGRTERRYADADVATEGGPPTSRPGSIEPPVVSEYSAEPVPGTRPECSTVRSAYESRSVPLTAAARHPRRMGQPPPTARYRVPGGGEPCPQGAGEGAPPAADRRPAPTPRGERSPTRSPGLAAGRNDRDSRHDPAMAPAADRPEVDVHAKRPGRPGIMQEISSLILRMATENPAWGYTRIRGALKNLGHEVARSTVANVLKANGIRPRRTGRRPGGRSSGPTGARSPELTYSPVRSGPLEG